MRRNYEIIEHILSKIWMISYLHTWKTDANHKISYPIDEDRDRHGRRSRTLREQFGRDHPRDRARPHGKKYHEKEGGHDRQIRHPVNHFLHITEKLLSGSRIVFFFPEQPEEFSLRRKLIVIPTKLKQIELNNIYTACNCVQLNPVFKAMMRLRQCVTCSLIIYNNILLLLSVQAI